MVSSIYSISHDDNDIGICVIFVSAISIFSTIYINSKLSIDQKSIKVREDSTYIVTVKEQKTKGDKNV